MPWLIMNDEIDYSATWYPTHVVSKDNKLLPVYIGASQTLVKGLVGLWVRDDDYSKIRHDKVYIFIHDPEADDSDVEDVNWDQVKDVKEQMTTGREHIHIWKEAEFKEISEGGTA